MFSKCSNDDKNTPQKTVHNRYSYMAASVMMAITGISSNVLGKDEFLKFVCGTDDNDGMFILLSLSFLMMYEYARSTHAHTHTDPKCTAWGVRRHVLFLNTTPETYYNHIYQTGTDKCNRSFNVLDSYSKCSVLLLNDMG